MPASLFDLSGKTALITGSSQGIGLAIAEEMGRLGARVVITSHDAAGCESACAALTAQGMDAISIVCDVAVDDDIDALVAQTLQLSGGVDILVCNAGINGPFGSILEIAQDDYDRIMRVNLHATLRLCKRLVPYMAAQRSGSVILMSSLSGLRGNRSIGAYALSKAALAQLARNLAVEFGPCNVRVNAISPGLIATPFSRSIMADADYLAARLEKTPLRRIGQPHEVAGAAVFLASDAGAFVTGHNLVVDGGTLVTD